MADNLGTRLLPLSLLRGRGATSPARHLLGPLCLLPPRPLGPLRFLRSLSLRVLLHDSPLPNGPHSTEAVLSASPSRELRGLSRDLPAPIGFPSSPLDSLKGILFANRGFF